MPRFAANLSLMFNEFPLVDRFQAAADAGFARVEIQFPYAEAAERLAERARAAAVEVVLINAPPGDFDAGERGLAGLADDGDRWHASLDLAAHYAGELGAGLVHVMSGNGDPHAPGVSERLAARLVEAADRLAGDGLATVIEPINPFDMPGYLLAHWRLAERIVREADRPHLRLLFDLYHRQRMAGDLGTALEALLPITGHVQVAGVPGRHEPAGGEVAWPWVFGRLDALGYAGVVGCEYRPQGGTVEGLGWMREVAG